MTSDVPRTDHHSQGEDWLYTFADIQSGGKNLDCGLKSVDHLTGLHNQDVVCSGRTCDIQQYTRHATGAETTGFLDATYDTSTTDTLSPANELEDPRRRTTIAVTHRCHLCQSTFTTKRAAMRHQRQSHRLGRTITCPSYGCSYTCVRRDYMTKHRRRNHRGD